LVRPLGAILVVALAATACATTTRQARPAPAAPPAPPALSTLARDLDAILAEPALQHGYWGVLVRSLDNDETLYSVNARRLMLPASSMKVVTLAAAAEKLGWDFHYDTTVYAAGAVEAGTLQGDLVVVGSGDPSLMVADGMADRVFAEWAGALKQRGIRTIAGRVVGDDNLFEDETLGFGWSWDDLPDDYAAGVGALQFNENAVRVTVAPGPAAGDSAGIAIAPGGSGLTVVNGVTTGAAGSATSVSTRRLPGTTTLELRGAIALGATPSTLDVSVDNPTQFFAAALRGALIANGIDVRGEAADIDGIRNPPRPAGPPLVVYRSPPLSALAVRLMKISQNQYAETFLKTLADGPVRSVMAGRTAALAILHGWGVQPSDLIMRDGSGLTRYDFVTPEALVTVLTHVYRDAKLRGPFEASLPIAGRDGTMANRLKGTAAEGNVRAKSGSMTGVRSLSGYVTSAGGEHLAFAIVANNFETPPDVVNAATDAIVVRLATFNRR
jgi:D-alanyl-D-alanine carboxypeptidase/D-alanyl-D-alanine-endopeptidase (penicillin-binding protein 4)